MMFQIAEIRRNEENDKLSSVFSELYHTSAEFLVKVPGRVNLIGEHIDYHGYPVLPMALEQCITIACSKNNVSQLIMHNLDSTKHKCYQTSTTDLTIEQSSVWHNYILCGYKAALELIEIEVSQTGINFLVSGNIPPSAGLSSSSALVCAAALATLATCGVLNKFTRADVADQCAKAERYIGTQGGGMDQAAALLSQEGNALLINFNPLRSELVKLPAGASFVVTNSCVKMDKAATSHYNTRVIEGRIAAKILGKVLNVPDFLSLKRLKDVQDACNKSLLEMCNLVEQWLPKDSYSRVEICEILSLDTNTFESQVLTPNTQHLQNFKLKQRALHVYCEALRVQLFFAGCQKIKSATQGDLDNLGSMMCDGHSSSKLLYECSHPVLDKLVDTCMQAGAFGSRLTGAGWGGCAVSMVAQGMVEKFIEQVKQDFYAQDSERMANVDCAIFSTAPSAGACVFHF